MPPVIQIKRAYDEPSKTDGIRILVDRLWPRGITKEKAAVKQWAKDLAPAIAGYLTAKHHRGMNLVEGLSSALQAELRIRSDPGRKM